MAYTITAVYISGTTAFVMFVVGSITLLVTRNKPDKKKWGWVLLALSVCALISAVVNLIGIY